MTVTTKKAGQQKVNIAQLVDQAQRHFAGASGLVQLIDRMAAVNGGKGPQHQAADEALNALLAALQECERVTDDPGATG